MANPPGKDLPSSPDVIYLTTAYAAYFAMNATPEKERWGIIEIDMDRLLDEDMVPDEDFMEQVTRGHTMENWDLPAAGMPGRTKWFSDRLTAFHPCWTDSLAGLGNCGYANSIPAEAITRVGLYDPACQPHYDHDGYGSHDHHHELQDLQGQVPSAGRVAHGRPRWIRLAFSFFAHADLRELGSKHCTSPGSRTFYQYHLGQGADGKFYQDWVSAADDDFWYM